MVAGLEVTHPAILFFVSIKSLAATYVEWTLSKIDHNQGLNLSLGITWFS